VIIAPRGAVNHERQAGQDEQREDDALDPGHRE
jgi:hypothetical protein